MMYLSGVALSQWPGIGILPPGSFQRTTVLTGAVVMMVCYLSVVVILRAGVEVGSSRGAAWPIQLEIWVRSGAPGSSNWAAVVDLDKGGMRSIN